MTRAMLNEIRQDLVKNYYDPKFQGFDVQARSDGKARAGHWRHQFGERHECADVPAHFGMDTIVSYAAEMSRANLIMRDGKSLEKSGGVPDETILPTAEDLASGRDPVLSQAVTLAGASISPEHAGNCSRLNGRRFRLVTDLLAAHTLPRTSPRMTRTGLLPSTAIAPSHFPPEIPGTAHRQAPHPFSRSRTPPPS